MFLKIFYLLLIAAYFYVGFLEDRKKKEYKNDERYQVILAKRDRLLLYCYEGVILFPIVIFIIIMAPKGTSIRFIINSDTISLFIIPYLVIRTVLGYLIMRYYDKRL